MAKPTLTEVFYLEGKLQDRKGREVTSGVTEDTFIYSVGKVSDHEKALAAAQAAMK